MSKTSASDRRELFNKYITPNLGLIYQICIENTCNPADVDDNYQECCINFFRYIASYDPTKKLSTWIGVITKRSVIEYEKKRALMKTDNVEPEAIANFFISPEIVHTNEFVASNYKQILSDEVIKALDSLDAKHRYTLLMSVSGYKLREIMDLSYKMGILKTKNIETVKSRLFLARQKLKEILATYYHEEKRDY